MNAHDMTVAQPPVDYRTDTPEQLDISIAQIIEYNADIIEKSLAGSFPESQVADKYADPFAGVDKDAIREYERWMDEIRAIRENKELREIGLDPEYEL